MVYRVSLLNKLKPNSYPKVYCVNVADRWRKGLDGYDKTDATYLRVGWKLRIENKNA